MLDIIRKILRCIKAVLPKGVETTILHHLINSGVAGELEPVGTMSLATIVSLNDDMEKESTLEEALLDKQWWRDRW